VKAVLLGICLSKVWTWTRVQDCLHGLSGWYLQTGAPVQQQVLPGSDVPAAHAGSGLNTPSASTAIRTWTKVFKCTTTIEQLQYHEFISSLVTADYIPQPMGQLVAVDAALPLTMEPHVAMEEPKGLETVEPVWSQWACFIGQ
jgi:hypothetical protein